MERTFGSPRPRPGRCSSRSSPGSPEQRRWRAIPPGIPPRRRPLRPQRGYRCRGPSSPPPGSAPPRPPQARISGARRSKGTPWCAARRQSRCRQRLNQSRACPLAFPTPAGAYRRQRVQWYPPKPWPRCRRRCPPGRSRPAPAPAVRQSRTARCAFPPCSGSGCGFPSGPRSTHRWCPLFLQGHHW